MKYKFFLSYVPFMLIISFLLMIVADNYDGKAVMVSYQTGTQGLGEYNGELIRDSGTAGATNQQESSFYNGRDIQDNGLPYCIKVNKTHNVVTIYRAGDNGYYNVPVKAMICSVGETGNTPEGLFELGGREEWLPLEGDVYGQYATVITGSFLFHSVPYFTQDKGDLEIEEYNKLGSSVSAGCVRLSVIDAKWIYDNCGEMTFVEIFESDYVGPLGKPVAAVISSGGSVGNWDPTDPDRENPYMGNIPMILGAYDREVERYSEFDVTSGVVALDSTGKEVTRYMTVEGEVDMTTCGIYKITYSITDETGITGAATANIIVKDEHPPVIYAEQKVERIGAYDVTDTEQLKERLLQNVVAYDGVQQLSPDDIIVDYSEILEKGYGKCHVKYRAEDSEGNRSEVVVLTIDVDMESPQLTLQDEQQGEIRISNMQKDEYLMGLVKAEDNSGKVDLTVSRPLTYTPGEPYIVMYCAKDEFGNVSTLSVTYHVKD